MGGNTAGGHFQRRGYVARSRARMLREIRRYVVLADPLGKAFAHQRRARLTQTLAFGDELLVGGQLLIEALQALVDLGYDATCRDADRLARCSSHQSSVSTMRNTTSISHRFA